MKGKKRIADGELEGWYWARRSKPSYRILPQDNGLEAGNAKVCRCL